MPRIAVCLGLACVAAFITRAALAEGTHALVRLPPVESQLSAPSTHSHVTSAAHFAETPSHSVPALEDLAWRKGDYRIVPYGIGWLNVAFETSRTTPGAFTLFAHGAQAMLHLPAIYLNGDWDDYHEHYIQNEQTTRYNKIAA